MATGNDFVDSLVQQTSQQGIDFDLNPVEPLVSPDSLYDQKVKAMYDAEPKKRIYIPTPPGWREANPYAERIEINGIVYIIQAERDVLVPESVWLVWKNKQEREREVNGMQAELRRRMEYTNISQVPVWLR